MDSSNAKSQVSGYKVKLNTMPISHWFLAAQTGATEMLNAIISAAYKAGRLEDFLDVRTACNETALMLAARKGHSETVEALFAAYDLCNKDKTNVQIALNQIDNFGRTPLMWAAQSGSPPTILALVLRLNPEQLSVALNLKNKYGKNVLMIAQNGGDIETVNFLISCLQKPNLPIPEMTLPEFVIAPVVFSNGEKVTKRPKTAQVQQKEVIKTKRKPNTEKASIPQVKLVEPKRKKKA
jgi:hypothetical protein